MNEVQILRYCDDEVRMVQKNGELWWVLKDVCNVLGLSNPSVIAERLDEDERSKFSLGRQGEVNIVNESGLYNVILRSDKPEAKPFKRWVTHEVLPSIRRTGEYSYSPAEMGKRKKYYNGIPVLTLRDIQELTGMKYSTLRYRLLNCGNTIQGVDWWRLDSQEAARFTRNHGMATATCIILASLNGVKKIVAPDYSVDAQMSDFKIFKQRHETMEWKVKAIGEIIHLIENEQNEEVKGYYFKMLNAISY